MPKHSLGGDRAFPKRELGNENKKDGAQARCLGHQKRDSSVAPLPQNDEESGQWPVVSRQ